MKEPKNILISRTDSIGDVVLTLPICFWLKTQFPNCKIIFLGNTYTQPVLECYPYIDEILEWKKVAAIPFSEQIELIQALHIDTCIHVFPRKAIAHLMKKAKVETRIGTSHRFFHLFTCNERVKFTRFNSDLHEAQLNFELLRPLGLERIPMLKEIEEMYDGFKAKYQKIPAFLMRGHKIVIHPKSNGSAVEWPIEKYMALAKKLAKEGRYVYFTGTEEEGKTFRHLIPEARNIVDFTGKFTLSELITFLSKCEAIIGCSTGPLHLGSILGLITVGIYSRTKPLHPGRWRPLGKKVFIFTNKHEPTEGKVDPRYVQAIEDYPMIQVFDMLEEDD